MEQRDWRGVTGVKRRIYVLSYLDMLFANLADPPSCTAYGPTRKLENKNASIFPDIRPDCWHTVLNNGPSGYRNFPGPRTLWQSNGT
jgi:hypothetical protein